MKNNKREELQEKLQIEKRIARILEGANSAPQAEREIIKMLEELPKGLKQKNKPAVIFHNDELEKRRAHFKIKREEDSNIIKIDVTVRARKLLTVK